MRGIGLAFGVELVTDRHIRAPATDIMPRLLNLLRAAELLAGSEGVYGNIIKMRPPIVFTREDVDNALGHSNGCEAGDLEETKQLRKFGFELNYSLIGH